MNVAPESEKGLSPVSPCQVKQNSINQMSEPEELEDDENSLYDYEYDQNPSVSIEDDCNVEENQQIIGPMAQKVFQPII